MERGFQFYPAKFGMGKKIMAWQDDAMSDCGIAAIKGL